jgi:TRAP transporter TAXI family solute receptor
MRVLLAAFVVILFPAIEAGAQELRNMSILTGQKTGTYFRFGNDIAELMRNECGADISVKESQGSLANLQRLRHEQHSQLAIVQQDTLDYLKQAASADTKLQDIVRNIRYVFPLYSEEVHLVTTKGSGIKSLRDIAGKRIAIGEAESGTYLTASFILLLSAIEVKRVEIGQIEGLRRLLLPAQDPNRIDALFYVAGAPVKLFAENPALRDQLAGVAIDDPAVLERYNASQLTSDDYGWIENKLSTVRVRSVLMTYDFQLEQCQNVGMVANRVKANLKALREGAGHAKWNEVELNAPLPGWRLYKCVSKYVDMTVGKQDRRCTFGEAPSAAGYMPPGQKPQNAGPPPSVCGAGKSDNPIVQSLCRNLKELQPPK